MKEDPPPPISIFLQCPVFAPHPSLPGLEPITVLGSPVLIAMLEQLGKNTHTRAVHTQSVSKHVSLKRRVRNNSFKNKGNGEEMS